MCAAKEIGALNKNGMQSLSEGNLANAEFMLLQALRKAAFIGSAAYTAKIQNNLGLLRYAQGKNADAARLFSAALIAVDEKIGKENRLYASILRNLESTGIKMDTAA